MVLVRTVEAYRSWNEEGRGGRPDEKRTRCSLFLSAGPIFCSSSDESDE